MTVVTISRQNGTGSREIAAQVARLLGYRHFDKWSIIKAAAELGLSENEVVDFSEEDYRVSGFLDKLLGRLPQPGLKIPIHKRDGSGTESLTIEQLDQEVCVDLVRAAVEAASRQGNMVILGRGSQAILQGNPHAFHVRIVAPLEDRVRRLMIEQAGLTRAEARNQAADHDRKTAEYLRHVHHIAWDDPTLYHLVLNVGKLEPEQVASIIADAVTLVQRSPAPVNL
ncbi:MAG: cytidylate kinase-like family protein [Anaerolineae bacterium]